MFGGVSNCGIVHSSTISVLTYLSEDIAKFQALLRIFCAASYTIRPSCLAEHSQYKGSVPSLGRKVDDQIHQELCNNGNYRWVQNKCCPR